MLADTAGRLHTKTNLMEELKKVRRVAERPPGQVTEVLLVIDATTGQNGLIQAQQFAAATGVTGVVLTKLDGTAKGGIAAGHPGPSSASRSSWWASGEGPDDLVDFDAAEFVDALVAPGLSQRTDGGRLRTDQRSSRTRIRRPGDRRRPRRPWPPGRRR